MDEEETKQFEQFDRLVKENERLGGKINDICEDFNMKESKRDLWKLIVKFVNNEIKRNFITNKMKKKSKERNVEKVLKGLKNLDIDKLSEKEVNLMFSDLIREKMPDKIFQKWAMSWMDGSDICDRAEEWHLESKKDTLKEFIELL